MNLFKSNKYSILIALHLLVGAVATVIPFITKIITPTIFILGCYYILKNRDKNNEVLYFSAYVVGIEVFLRMTGGMFFNEYGKYTISLFCLLGILFHPVRMDKMIFMLLLLLLIPGVFIGLTESSFSAVLRKTIMFNLSGELCLLACCFYTINNKITYSQLLNVVLFLALPILTIVSFVIFKTPDKNIAIVSTNSNFATSGGFGPNQVSTILGLGTFCFFTLFMLKKTKLIEKVIYMVLFVVCAYRGVITFSRGGMICAGIMIIALLTYIFIFSNEKTKFRILISSGIGFISILLFWSYISYTTDGLINKRYSNEDVRGRKKESVLSGRETIMESEIDMFFNNPLLGVGVGRTREVRENEMGLIAANHNEITRLLAEHGSLGIIYFLIITMVPIFLWFNNKQHILLIPFFIFWALTINHAAMRTAAPAFIYALCLLKIYIPKSTESNNEITLHREQITT